MKFILKKIYRNQLDIYEYCYNNPQVRIDYM